MDKKTKQINIDGDSEYLVNMCYDSTVLRIEIGEIIMDLKILILTPIALFFGLFLTIKPEKCLMPGTVNAKIAVIIARVTGIVILITLAVAAVIFIILICKGAVTL